MKKTVVSTIAILSITVVILVIVIILNNVNTKRMNIGNDDSTSTYRNLYLNERDGELTVEAVSKDDGVETIRTYYILSKTENENYIVYHFEEYSIVYNKDLDSYGY